ncbi:hypothetical protein MSHO_00040 [Mycobacterium shottsii]|uniref:Rv2525c-like glycoside hydrolase-like domain-containing protein n=1 Tax=Mycobacterium shottsii TaxID=133549 RepID=A0A7I7L5D9_9MYCO|nr:DUF1906 domain-containing protein [Mycobacterium shottsii]BBX54659.1 hypothetical protein MSHO_00040 [Mycobacterium shottsii]
MYANSKTIDWAVRDGLGSYFWQHNWGSPKGYTHPAANLHQVEIDKRKVGGVGVDINEILKPQFGRPDLRPGHPLGPSLQQTLVRSLGSAVRADARALKRLRRCRTVALALTFNITIW